MLSEREVMYAREVRRDALAAAEKERLIRQVQQARAPVRIPYRFWIARLGEQMIVWGQRLQARYAS